MQVINIIRIAKIEFVDTLFEIRITNDYINVRVNRQQKQEDI